MIYRDLASWQNGRLTAQAKARFVMKVSRMQDKAGSQHVSDRLQDVQGLPTAASVLLSAAWPPGAMPKKMRILIGRAQSRAERGRGSAL